MARLRLQTQLLISTLLIISTLTGSILLVIRQTIRAQIAGQVRDSTAASVQGFDVVQRQFQVQLSRTAALLAEIPTMKALMTTTDAPTIQDASIPFWQLSGSDLFLLADPAGRVMALHLKHEGLDKKYAEDNVAAALNKGQDSAWWYSGGRLYWVFLRSITAGAGINTKLLGHLAIGYEADAGFAEPLSFLSENNIVLSSGDRVIASPFSPEVESELRYRLVANEIVPGARVHEVVLGEDVYDVVTATLHDRLPAQVQCYVFVSVTRPTAFIRTLNRTILIIGLTAIFLVSLLLSFVSGTITRPLENLVAGVRALAAGDYAYTITPRGSSEVAELGESFSRMRRDLLTSQRKQIESERVAAVGRAANSISHDLRHHLSAVIANAEFLYEAEILKLDRDDIYGEIQTASAQMTELLDSLRDVAREERNITPTPAAMDQTVRRAVDAVRLRPEFRNHDISIRMTGDMDGNFDAKKMERVFLNLGINACEALAQKAGQIVFEVSSTPDQFNIRISDNGPGIPPSIQTNLFDPFVSSGKSNGTGLGLAIVSKIVHDHDGSVIVKNTSDKGTTFLIAMPRFQRVTTPTPPEKST
jgi:signal transduction histidine kinase